MNIKRAFFAATAALVLPGLAMAQTSQTSFPTSIDFVNGYDGTVNVALTCNSGNPLVQDFDISEGAGVTFVVNGIVEGSTCTVALSGVDEGYTTSPASCVFSAESDPALAIGGVNTCAFVATPELSTFTVNRVWNNDSPDVSENARAFLNCDHASADAAGPYDGFFKKLGNPAGDRVQVSEFYVDPNAADGASCHVTVADNVDSAVEVDNGCEGPIAVAFAGEAECTITFTVFYEGIPTLSQYGMAIMVLLMLGVGFVGFRRFV